MPAFGAKTRRRTCDEQPGFEHALALEFKVRRTSAVSTFEHFLQTRSDKLARRSTFQDSYAILAPKELVCEKTV